MRNMKVLALCAFAVLAGCGDAGGEYAAEESSGLMGIFDINEPMPEIAPAGSPDSLEVGKGSTPADADTVRPPQIAYVYDYGFRLSGDAIAPLQQRHADLCESKGATKCRILEMSQSGSEGDYVYGHLNLAVAADIARDFGKELGQSAESAGGEQVSSAISGEDLSKQIVDTEARLRARTVLRDRLMEVLKSRKGTVQELVDAERGVAQVNEEIDQAQSWLAEMKGRVNFSRVNIRYESGSPSSGGFLEPIRSALGSLGSVLGNVIAVLIVLIVGLIPIVALVGAIIWGGRRLGWLRRSKNNGHHAEVAEKTPPEP